MRNSKFAIRDNKLIMQRQTSFKYTQSISVNYETH